MTLPLLPCIYAMTWSSCKRCFSCADAQNADEWAADLQSAGVPALAWPQDFEPAGKGKLEDVTFIACWRPPPDLLGRCPNLSAVHSLGAGVDSILPIIPEGIPLARLVRP